MGLISFDLHPLKMPAWGAGTGFGELTGIYVADAERRIWPPDFSGHLA